VVIARLRTNGHAHRIQSFRGFDENAMISFVCADKHLSFVLQSLEETGLGIDFGHIDIVALQSTIPSLVEAEEAKHPSRPRRKYRFGERKTVREIEEAIDANLHLTFDFVALTLVAGGISAIGLLTDSAVVVVSSMLVSPLMGPILGIAYGAAVSRWDFVCLGFRNEAIAVLICVFCGCFIGSLSILFYDPLGNETLKELTQHERLRSEEIESRGRPVALFTGFWTATASGVGVALATTNAAISTLVGVAISSALLPPIINASICATLGVIYALAQIPGSNSDMRFLEIGFFSFCLFVINFVTICVTAICTFRLKNINSRQREFNAIVPRFIRKPLIHLKRNVFGQAHPDQAQAIVIASSMDDSLSLTV